MTISLADVSEFQTNVDAPSYIAGGHTCLIARAHNGWRPDHMWPARRDYLRKHNFTALGFYQYLVAAKDAAEQAREFVATVGDLRDNEFVILDHEEGAGDQTPRAQAWFAVVDAHYGKLSSLYSGEFFGRTNLGGWAHWAGRPRWIAAYQSAPPPDPHELWQNTDRGSFPGIGTCDGNLFFGTDQQFEHVFCQYAGDTPGHRPTPPPPTPTGVQVIHPILKQNGAIELFAEDNKTGEVLHTWQTGPNTAWMGAEKGKRHAGWESLGVPAQNKV